MKTAIALLILSATVAVQWPKNELSKIDNSSAPSPVAAQPPVGGPSFAQPAPFGLPSSFSVSYVGPPVSFSTVCYYTGKVGEIHRWVSSTGVVISFHTGIPLAPASPPVPTGAWLLEIGSANSGLAMSPYIITRILPGDVTVR